MIREVFVSDVMTKYRCYSRSTKGVNTMMMMIIGVARYGALGHVLPPLDFQLFNFSGHFRATQHKL